MPPIDGFKHVLIMFTYLKCHCRAWSERIQYSPLRCSKRTCWNLTRILPMISEFFLKFPNLEQSRWKNFDGMQKHFESESSIFDYNFCWTQNYFWLYIIFFDTIHLYHILNYIFNAFPFQLLEFEFRWMKILGTWKIFSLVFADFSRPIKCCNIF